MDFVCKLYGNTYAVHVTVALVGFGVATLNLALPPPPQKLFNNNALFLLISLEKLWKTTLIMLNAISLHDSIKYWVFINLLIFHRYSSVDFTKPSQISFYTNYIHILWNLFKVDNPRFPISVMPMYSNPLDTAVRIALSPLMETCSSLWCFYRSWHWTPARKQCDRVLWCILTGGQYPGPSTHFHSILATEAKIRILAIIAYCSFIRPGPLIILKNIIS